MEIEDPKILALRKQVTAAQREFDMAVAFHDVWKPAAYDRDLHSRLGTSYATQAFLVARTALRREMLLALARLWDVKNKDKDKQAIRMTLVSTTLRNKEVIDALAFDRAKRGGWLEALDEMRTDLRKKTDEAVLLLNKYMEGGTHYRVLRNLLTLRHERLAHHQLVTTTATRANATDEEIEEFFQDHSRLIELLLGVVNAMAYDPQDTAEVFGFYASHFWKRVT
jgi:AbiU2